MHRTKFFSEKEKIQFIRVVCVGCVFILVTTAQRVCKYMASTWCPSSPASSSSPRWGPFPSHGPVPARGLSFTHCLSSTRKHAPPVFLPPPCLQPGGPPAIGWRELRRNGGRDEKENVLGEEPGRGGDGGGLLSSCTPLLPGKIQRSQSDCP